MLDHIGLSVANYPKAKAFYDAVMPTIGASCVMAVTAEETGGTYEGAGYGLNGKPSFWIGTGGRTKGSLHIAFVAEPCRRRRLLCSGNCGRRNRQRASRDPRALPSQLLRRLRFRSRRAQHRGRLPQTGVSRRIRRSPLPNEMSSIRLIMDDDLAC